ncbi:hypothetical protein RUM43_005969 [Polyplax serrata]|uniref:Uncharacterized protein n=1 Tax=Polyplax serrata TaxID=468196 RepID=A0AAN8PBY5_POLSC
MAEMNLMADLYLLPPKSSIGTLVFRGEKLTTNSDEMKLLLLLYLCACFTALAWGAKQNFKTNFWDKLISFFLCREHKYAITVEAENAKTVVNVFDFVVSSSCKDPTIKLADTYTTEYDDGFPNYEKNYTESLNLLEKIMKDIKKRVPKKKWPKTSLQVVLTSDFGLMNEFDRSKILGVSKLFFENQGFTMGKNSLLLLTGKQEGLFAWFSVNLLLNRLGNAKEKPVTALTLGSRVAQVSMSVCPNAQVPVLSDVLKMTAYDTEYSVYCHSDWKLGTEIARRRILTHQQSSCYRKLLSVCLHPGTNVTWTYNRLSYTTHGAVNCEKNGFDYEACESLVQTIVRQSTKAPCLGGAEVYAFEDYFDLALQMKLIKKKNGKKISLQKFISRSRELCETYNAENPFLCLDSIYATVLLRDFYGLRVGDSVMFLDAVKGQKVSWSLSLAFLTTFAQNELRVR